MVHRAAEPRPNLPLPQERGQRESFQPQCHLHNFNVKERHEVAPSVEVRIPDDGPHADSQASESHRLSLWCIPSFVSERMDTHLESTLFERHP